MKKLVHIIFGHHWKLYSTFGRKVKGNWTVLEKEYVCSRCGEKKVVNLQGTHNTKEI